MKRILVIEDDSHIRGNIVEMVGAEGYEVLEADCGRHGLEAASAQVPDLVICDVMMPDVDGHQVLEELRRRPETRTVPFIFLTARADRQDMRQGMNLGADDYITKPFRRRELLDALGTRLRRADEIARIEQERLGYAAERLRKTLSVDEVTGLPNRLRLNDCVAMFQRAARERGQYSAIIVVGIDRYYEFFDALPPPISDEVLRLWSQRLSAHVGTLGTVLRLQPDQFAVVLGPIATCAEAGPLARGVVELLEPPIEIADERLQVRCSVGIALSPLHGESDALLVQRASHAMQRARAAGGGSWEMARESGAGVFRSQLALESEMAAALHAGGFEVHYQPRVALSDWRVVGAEALLRWRRRGSFVPASEFIAVAEDCGLIVPLAREALSQVLGHMSSWRPVDGFRIAINVSAHQLCRPDFMASLLEAARRDEVACTRLDLEITESVLVRDLDLAAGVLVELRRQGFRVAMDDFGTGYSSLSYLSRLPLDMIKIDRSFITDLPLSGRNRAIVKAVIEMGHKLDLTVVAEGVEHQEQLDFLRDQGCDEVQGFFFSRALPASELNRYRPPQRDALIGG